MTTPMIQETADQRKKRLMTNAAAHHLRVKSLRDGSYLVPSTRRGANGKPVADYHVRPVSTERGPGWYCGCEWSTRHGTYVAGVTDLALCSHASQVVKHEERTAREALRATRRLVEAADQIARGKPATMDQRRALANAALQAGEDLFGPTWHNVSEGGR